MFLLGSFSGAGASPYHIPGLDAAREWEIKVAAERFRQGNERLLAAPVVDLTAPLRPGLEASMSFGRGRHESGDGRTHEGWLDTEFALKWEVKQAGAGGGFGVTVEPALIAPTGSAQLTGEHWVLELPVAFGWTFDAVELRTLIGYAHALENDDDEILCGGVVEYQISERLSVGAELTAGTPSRDFDAWQGSVDVGFKLGLTSTIELQGRLGRSVHSQDEPHSAEGAIYLQVAL